MLRIARGFELPLDMVTEATAIVATRGAGKSSTSAVIVEEGFRAHVQTVVLDRTGVYWGLRSNAKGDGPGLPIYVLGGPHGDVPLETHAGAMIADLVVDSGHSFVLDLSDFSKSAAIRFAADFLERLYDRKARTRTTTLVVIDEAHFYAPQTPRGGFKGDAARLMGAMEDVVGLGRSRGLGAVLTTQRTQALNKAVLDLIETLLVMRMLSPRARDAVQDWIREKHEDDREGVIETLESLPTGTAWVWSPLRGVLRKVAVRRIRTFDSYATPKPGERQAEPTTRRELDLAALGDRIRATAEKAKENDPVELRKRARDAAAEASALRDEVEELGMQLAVAREELAAAREETKVEVERVEVPVISDEQMLVLTNTANDLLGLGDQLGEFREYLRDAVAPIAEAKRRVEQFEPPAPPPPREPTREPTRAKPELQGRRVSVPLSPNGDSDLGTGAPSKMLQVLATFPDGRTQNQLAVLSGYSRKSSTFRNGLSRLRSRGYAEGSDRVRITEDGKRVIGDVEPLPVGHDLYLYWRQQLGDGAPSRFLEVLYSAYPAALSKADLAARAGYSTESSTFRNGLSRLRSLELALGSTEIRVSDVFFEGVIGRS